MLNINTDQIYIAMGVTDLRKSIDGLSILVKESFHLDPFSKSLFVFCSRKRDKIKILEWNLNGFWLHYKRLEKSIFRWLLDGLSIDQKDTHREVKERTII